MEWGGLALAEPESATARRVLDAALELFTAQGVRATTMSQLAADAGISRVWLYRFFDNRDAVVASLLAREGGRFLRDLVELLEPDRPVLDAVCAGFEHSIVTFRQHPLVQRVLLEEPEVAAPFIGPGTGPLLRAAQGVIATFLEDRAAMPGAEALAVADTLLRLALSIVLTNETEVDFDDPRARRAWIRRIIPRLLDAG